MNSENYLTTVKSIFRKIAKKYKIQIAYITLLVEEYSNPHCHILAYGNSKNTPITLHHISDNTIDLMFKDINMNCKSKGINSPEDQSRIIRYMLSDRNYNMKYSSWDFYNLKLLKKHLNI